MRQVDPPKTSQDSEDDRRAIARLPKLETFGERARRERGRLDVVLVLSAALLTLVAGVVGTIPSVLSALDGIVTVAALASVVGALAAGVSVLVATASAGWLVTIRLRTERSRGTGLGDGKAQILDSYERAIERALRPVAVGDTRRGR